MEERAYSFEPVVGDAPRILILGTMPGAMSLERHEYYANPRNKFWELVASALGQEAPASYAEKIDMLKKNKIALWDCIEACDRVGSLDKDIKDVTPNDINKLLDENPTIAFVCFNGREAEKIFVRHFGGRKGVECHRLPSSSPAHANKDKPVLWQKLLQDLLNLP